VRALSHSFGGRCGTRRVPALSGASFSLHSGINALLGPNGAGKTTLLRLLATTLRVQHGQIEIGDVRFGAESATKGSLGQYRRRLGYLPQRGGYLGHLTCEEYVAYVAWLRGMPGKVVPEAASTALAKVGLGDHRRTKLTALSGGMLRRVGIAQAVVNQPDLLILDEPTAGLDPEQRQGFYEVLASLDPSTSVLLSTHLLEDVEALQARVVVLAGGTVRFEGSSTELAELGGGPGLRPAYIKLVGSPPVQLPPS
jgi:ABC-2 type transport system ATP-binding protein